MGCSSDEYKDRAAIVAEGLLSIDEAARFLKLSRAKIYSLMEQGRLVFVKLDRTRRIPRRAVVEIAAQHLRGGWRERES